MSTLLYAWELGAGLGHIGALKLRRVLLEADFALNAQAFARKYENFPQDTVIAHLIRRIEEIAAAKAPIGGST